MNIKIGEKYSAKSSPLESALVTNIRTIGSKGKTIFIKFIYCTSDEEINGLEDEVLIETFEEIFKINEYPDR